MTVFLGILFSPIREIEVPYVFDLNMELLSMKCRGIGPHLAARGKTHEFSRVAAGTWCIFSSYGGDGHLKLGFVQQRQDSCLVMTDTSGSYTMLGRKIQTLLEVSQEAKRPLSVGSYIGIPINFHEESGIVTF